MVFEIENYATLKTAVEEFCAFLYAENIPEECIFNSKLVAYELLGNILKHADSKAQFCGKIEKEMVEIKVLSAKSFIPPEKTICAEVLSEHGRGLFLIDELCLERTHIKNGICVRIKIK